MPGGRPARPMFGAEEECLDGALDYEAAVAFTSLSRSEIERAVRRGEIEEMRHGRKPLLPKRQVVRWLAAKLEEARAKEAGRA